MRKVFSKAEITDKELMDRIKDSDERAFRMLFDRYWKPLYAMAFSYIDNEDVAKDIVQDLWINIWELRKKIVNDNIKAYLYQSVRYAVYAEFKNNKKLVTRLDILDSFLASNNISDFTNFEDLNKVLDQSINKLPARQREIFVLSRIDGKNNQEISEELGISKRTVENHLTSALRVVRKDVVIVALLSLGEMYV